MLTRLTPGFFCSKVRNIFLFMRGGFVGIQRLFPLTAEQWRAELSNKGWTAEMLSIRWGVTKRRVQQMINDENRPLYLDDALRHLPIIIKVGE